MILTAAIIFTVTFFIPFIALLNKGAMPEFLKTIGGRIEEVFPNSLSLIKDKADSIIKPVTHALDDRKEIVHPVTTEVVENFESGKFVISGLFDEGTNHAKYYYGVVSNWVTQFIKSYKLDQHYHSLIDQSIKLLEISRLPQVWYELKKTTVYQYLDSKVNHLLNEWQILLQKNEPFFIRCKTHLNQLFTDYIESKFESSFDVYRYGTKQEKFDLAGELIVYFLVSMFVINLILHSPSLYRALVQDATEFSRNARTISQQVTIIEEEPFSTRIPEEIIVTTVQKKEQEAEISVTTTSSSYNSIKEERYQEEDQQQQEQKGLNGLYQSTFESPDFQYNDDLNQLEDNHSISIPVEAEINQETDEQINIPVYEIDEEVKHPSKGSSQDYQGELHEDEDSPYQNESFNELESMKSFFKGKDLSEQLSEALSNDIRNDFNNHSRGSLSVSSSVIQGTAEGSPDSSISPGDEVFTRTPLRNSHHSALSFSSNIGQKLISPSKLIYAPTNTPTSKVNDNHVYSDIIVPNSPQKKIKESIQRSVSNDAESVISNGSPESSISIE